jgi:hypothetical protein
MDAYAVVPGKEGWLDVKTKKTAERWVVVKEDVLKVYAVPEDPEPLLTVANVSTAKLTPNLK